MVYGTRSQFRAENEAVVNRSIEFINMMQQKKTPWRVSPPVIPLSQRDIENESPLSGKFLSFPADYTTSGCFIATITREVRKFWIGKISVCDVCLIYQIFAINEKYKDTKMFHMIILKSLYLG